MFKCSFPYVILGDGKLRGLNSQNLKSPTDGKIFGCGYCYYCKQKKAQDWTKRLQMEAKYHDNVYFITLTYNNENLPYELQVADLQKFIKRLRKDFKLRYFACGEYGGRTLRPHYHMILFTDELIDDFVYIPSENQYYSKYITKKWGLGFTTISHALKEHLAYTALYTTKKLTKYERNKIVFDDENGELKYNIIFNKKPEFLLMSKRPLIGYQYLMDNLDYFKEHPGDVPVAFIKEKYFGWDDAEMIRDCRTKFAIDNFWKNGDPFLNSFKHKTKENFYKKLLKNKRNNV